MAFVTVGVGGSAGNIGVLTTAITPYQRLPIAYSKKFLMRLERLNDEPFTKFVTEYPVTGHQGSDVNVTVTGALALATAPLAEDRSTGKESYTSSTSAKLTLDFFGNDTGWSTKGAMTMVDIAEETHSAELAINARETMAQLVVEELDGLTPTYWNSQGTFAELVTAVRTLRANRVRGFRELNGMYVGVIGPYLWEDLTNEGSPAYKDHYQTPTGSDVLAEGQLSKPIAGVQLFLSNMNTSPSATAGENEYFWGEGAIGTVQLRSTIAGVDGQPISMEGLNATLIGYYVPARAEIANLYGLKNYACWRAGLLDYEIVDANRAYLANVCY